MDSVAYVTMLLLDKSYYDYDYEKVEKPEPIIPWENTIKTEEEVQDILSTFGIGNKKPKTTEDIQNHIIKQEGYGS